MVVALKRPEGLEGEGGWSLCALHLLAEVTVQVCQALVVLPEAGRWSRGNLQVLLCLLSASQQHNLHGHTCKRTPSQTSRAGRAGRTGRHPDI